MIEKNPDNELRTEKVVAAKTPTAFATLSDLARAVPTAWKGAELRISNSIGTPHRIRRISFHENEDGKRVVMLYEDKLDPK
jgi:hypothetical protein